jgi:hypothetical protein
VFGRDNVNVSAKKHIRDQAQLDGFQFITGKRIGIGNKKTVFDVPRYFEQVPDMQRSYEDDEIPLP